MLAAPRSWAAPLWIRELWRADSLSGRFARGAAWSLVGAVVAQGANLATSVITARLLGREGFGKYGIIQATVGMLGVFAGMGLGLTATKYVAEFRTRDPERAGRIIALSNLVAVLSSGILALALFTFAPFLAAKTLNAPDLVDELRIVTLVLFLNALNGAQVGALSGFEAFRTIARINTVRGIATLPVTAVGVLFWGLPGAMWALAVPAFLQCAASQVSLRCECQKFGIRLRYSSGWQERRVLWTFSTPAFLSGALVAPAIWGASTMLANQPNGFAEMGIFSAASQWRNAIAFVPNVMAQFALPLLSNLHSENDRARYGKALRWNLALTTVAATAVAVPICVAAPHIMRLYGRDFQQGWLVLVLSAAAAVISCANGVVGTAIMSSGSVWVGFAFNAMWAAVLVGGCYCLVPTKLAVGMATSVLGAYCAHTVWQAVYLRHRLVHQELSPCDGGNRA